MSLLVWCSMSAILRKKTFLGGQVALQDREGAEGGFDGQLLGCGQAKKGLFNGELSAKVAGPGAGRPAGGPRHGGV